MGPNSARILEELFTKYPLHFTEKDEVLDLGCGTGLTSLIIAKETGAKVYADDLWIRAEDNAKRFEQWGVGEQIIQIIGNSNRIETIKVWEMDCFSNAWNEWFATNNEYAKGDKQYFEALIKPYTCFVGIYVKIK